MKRHARRRIVWVATMLVLSMSLIMGCASGTGSQSNNGGQAASSGTGDAAAGEGAQNSEGSEPVEIQFMVPSYADVPNMDDEYWSEWKKQVNVNPAVEWIPSGDYDTKFDLVLASGNLPEVIVATSVTHPTLLKAIEQGAFWDLTPFLGDFSEYPNLKENSEANVWNYLKVKGNIYGIPRNRPHVDVAINIRKDWLDKFGLPVPATMDEYAEALKTIVKGDPDGNGRDDTLGIIGHGFLMDDGDNNYLAAFGGLDPIFDEQGGLMKETLTPNYTEMVAWFRDLYAGGVLAKEFPAIKKTQAEEMFATGRAASYARNVWRDYTWEQDIHKVQPEAELITLPPMQGPGGVSVALATPFSGAFYISKKVPEEKVKQILAFFERTTTMEQTDYNYYGIEGVHHELVDGQPQLTELGVKQVTANGTGAIFPLAYNNKMKVINAAAPKAYNDAKMEAVANFSEIGKINLFSILSSETWTAEWPKYQAEWESMVTKAIVGQVSMEDYQAYVDDLNAKPEFKQAYQEFAAMYHEKFD